MICLKRESGKFSFHFWDVFQKFIDYIGKLLIRFRDISKFCKKFYVLDKFKGSCQGVSLTIRECSHVW